MWRFLIMDYSSLARGRQAQACVYINWLGIRVWKLCSTSRTLQSLLYLQFDSYRALSTPLLLLYYWCCHFSRIVGANSSSSSSWRRWRSVAYMQSTIAPSEINAMYVIVCTPCLSNCQELFLYVSETANITLFSFPSVSRLLSIFDVYLTNDGCCPQTALLVYEYFLVLSREVDHFWNYGRPTWPVILFFFNRYFTLFGNIPVVFETFWYSTAADKMRVSYFSWIIFSLKSISQPPLGVSF